MVLCHSAYWIVVAYCIAASWCPAPTCSASKVVPVCCVCVCLLGGVGGVMRLRCCVVVTFASGFLMYMLHMVLTPLFMVAGDCDHCEHMGWAVQGHRGAFSTNQF